MDAMLCAAKLIVQSNKVAKEYGGLATTGILKGTPEAVNTMAHTVAFTLDIRHVSNDQLTYIEQNCREAFNTIARQDSEKGCEVSWKSLVDSPAVNFDEECIAAVRASAEDACKNLPKVSEDGQQWKYVISGAGHDSCYTSQRCPSTMIFAVTKDGISHNPREYCSPEDW
jgi:acetylornithine deacetylase/succinyl-diaminopimelate desuccinylase-like protein